MNLSDIIMQVIIKELEEQGGTVLIARNELAEDIGCVPSQISYVITSRFTPQQGYLVESRRGGGGYIKITRTILNEDELVSYILQTMNEDLSFRDAYALLSRLFEKDIITQNMLVLMETLLSDSCLRDVASTNVGFVRASLIRHMLISLNL